MVVGMWILDCLLAALVSHCSLKLDFGQTLFEHNDEREAQVVKDIHANHH